MPLSVSSAEAGLLAAPWEGAEQDAVLEQAARSFYAQTADLTQHGKKDHPTDRVVLDDTAARLALELGAEAPGGREASRSDYVKLPGSGDGFTVTVYADGHEDLKRRAHGPEGDTGAPGADAVLARYGGLIGHAPSQDELAGFLAARVAGGAEPGGAGAGPVLTVTGADGSVLATGTASALLLQWQALVALNGAVTPNIDEPGEPSRPAPLLNATQGAAFLLGLVAQSGAAQDGAAPGLVASYNGAVAWFGRIDQPMLAVAAHYEALARSDAGNADRVLLDQTAAKLALEIAAEPEGVRGSLSETVHLRGHETRVTVSQTTADLTGGAQFHDLDHGGLFSVIEQAVGVVADVLSFVPGVNAVAIPVAIAVSAAEGAQELAEGDLLGGVLSLAGAAAGGAGAWAQGVAAGAEAGSAAARTASEVSEVAREVSRGVAAAQGLRGVVSAAESGDALAALTSAAGGLAGSVFAGTDVGRALEVGSALAGAGVAAAGGDWMRALAATETAAAGAGLFGGGGGASGAGQPGPDPAAGAGGGAAAAQGATAQVAAQTAVAGAGDALGGTGAASNNGDSAQQQADTREAEARQAVQQAGVRQAQAGAAAAEPGLPGPPDTVFASSQVDGDAQALQAGLGPGALAPSASGLAQWAQNRPAGTASDTPQPWPASASPPAPLPDKPDQPAADTASDHPAAGQDGAASPAVRLGPLQLAGAVSGETGPGLDGGTTPAGVATPSPALSQDPGSTALALPGLGQGSSGPLGPSGGGPAASVADGTPLPDSAGGGSAGTAVQIASGFAGGVWSGIKGMAQGLWSLSGAVGRVAEYVADPGTPYQDQVDRQVAQAGTRAMDAAASALDDPPAAAQAARDAVVGAAQDAYGQFKAGQAEAVQAGTLPAFYGGLAGRGVFEAATVVGPLAATKLVEGAGAAAKVAEGADLAGDAGRAASAGSALDGAAPASTAQAGATVRLGGATADSTNGALETGARRVLRDMTSPDTWDKAATAYDAIRADRTDVGVIAKSSGFSVEDINDIKSHVFFNQHQLDVGLAKFDPDPAIVNAWSRLRTWDFTTGDIDFLHHEMYELSYEQSTGADYRTSHQAAIDAGKTWKGDE